MLKTSFTVIRQSDGSRGEPSSLGDLQLKQVSKECSAMRLVRS